jgi:hypothetical protein
LLVLSLRDKIKTKSENVTGLFPYIFCFFISAAQTASSTLASHCDDHSQQCSARAAQMENVIDGLSPSLSGRLLADGGQAIRI